MPRIKVVDLPKDQKLSWEELKKITGGKDIKAFQKLKSSEDEFSSVTALPRMIAIGGRHNIA